MDVFKLRDRVVDDYGRYVRSFIRVADPDVAELVDRRLSEGVFWPEPLLQLNPAFEPGEPFADLVAQGILHECCPEIFSTRTATGAVGSPFRLHQHQVDAIRAYSADDNYVLTTGTGSGKSLAYMKTFPIVKKRDLKAHGAYRTKDTILSIYDAMSEAARTTTPYQTLLDPPPADPSLCHAPREESPA